MIAALLQKPKQFTIWGPNDAEIFTDDQKSSSDVFIVGLSLRDMDLLMTSLEELLAETPMSR